MEGIWRSFLYCVFLGDGHKYPENWTISTICRLELIVSAVKLFHTFNFIIIWLLLPFFAGFKHSVEILNKIYVLESKCERYRYENKIAKYWTSKPANKHTLRLHGNKQNNDVPFKCQYCEFITDQTSSLQEHLQSHHLKRPYICENCWNILHSKEVIDNHYGKTGGKS